MSALAPRLYADLIGKPFVDGGRGPDGYDCWGLAQAVWRRMGHEPTDFPSDPALLRHALQDEWQPLERHEVRPGDGILMNSDSPWMWHIGVVLDASRMLHTRIATGACCVRFDLPLHCRRIVGFYRFRGRPA